MHDSRRRLARRVALLTLALCAFAFLVVTLIRRRVTVA